MSVHHRIGQPPGLTSQHVLDAGGLGVLPEQVPTTGEHGGSVLANEAADAANAGKELRAVVTSAPSGGNVTSFLMQSDGSFDLVVTADGTYTIGYTVYIDGASDGAVETTITVGAGGGGGGGGEDGTALMLRRRMYRRLLQ